jgi:catechol 2,3-dioxygenase-like lactoylglutathione lyase family enzyme
MDNFYARTVLFVKDAEAALAFYTNILGFKLDWNYQHEGRAWVFQVSLFGFEVILNQVFRETTERAGHGRVFIGLEGNQAAALCDHVRAKGISVSSTEWGQPTLIINDEDGNELFFWLPEGEVAKLEAEMTTRKAGPVNSR